MAFILDEEKMNAEKSWILYKKKKKQSDLHYVFEA